MLLEGKGGGEGERERSGVEWSGVEWRERDQEEANEERDQEEANEERDQEEANEERDQEEALLEGKGGVRCSGFCGQWNCLSLT
jgi:hypothetical protein